MEIVPMAQQIAPHSKIKRQRKEFNDLILRKEC